MKYLGNTHEEEAKAQRLWLINEQIAVIREMLPRLDAVDAKWCAQNQQKPGSYTGDAFVARQNLHHLVDERAQLCVALGLPVPQRPQELGVSQ